MLKNKKQNNGEFNRDLILISNFSIFLMWYWYLYWIKACSSSFLNGLFNTIIWYHAKTLCVVNNKKHQALFKRYQHYPFPAHVLVKDGISKIFGLRAPSITIITHLHKLILWRCKWNYEFYMKYNMVHSWITFWVDESLNKWTPY